MHIFEHITGEAITGQQCDPAPVRKYSRIADNNIAKPNHRPLRSQAVARS